MSSTAADAAAGSSGLSACWVPAPCDRADDRRTSTAVEYLAELAAVLGRCRGMRRTTP
jgi:hypothetical protein